MNYSHRIILPELPNRTSVSNTPELTPIPGRKKEVRNDRKTYHGCTVDDSAVPLLKIYHRYTATMKRTVACLGEMSFRSNPHSSPSATPGPGIAVCNLYTKHGPRRCGASPIAQDISADELAPYPAQACQLPNHRNDCTDHLRS